MECGRCGLDIPDKTEKNELKMCHRCGYVFIDKSNKSNDFFNRTPLKCVEFEIPNKEESEFKAEDRFREDRIVAEYQYKIEDSESKSKSKGYNKKSYIALAVAIVAIIIIIYSNFSQNISFYDNVIDTNFIDLEQVILNEGNYRLTINMDDTKIYRNGESSKRIEFIVYVSDSIDNIEVTDLKIDNKDVEYKVEFDKELKVYTECSDLIDINTVSMKYRINNKYDTDRMVIDNFNSSSPIIKTCRIMVE